VEFSYVSHHDHGYHTYIAQQISGTDTPVPTSPAVVETCGCQQGNISYFNAEYYDFSYFGAVKLARMGVVGFYGASKNAGGSTASMRADYVYNALLYENATLGEAQRDSLNAVMLFTKPDSEYVWRPQFYGDPALNPYDPPVEAAIKPGKNIVEGNKVTAYPPEGYWVTEYWDGYCNDSADYPYGFDGPGFVQVSSSCGWPKGSRPSLRNKMGRRVISKFNVDRVVTNVLEQEGIPMGLGFNHENLSDPDAKQFVVDIHPDGSSTVYMNIRFQIFDHATGLFDEQFSKLEYYLQ
jgi:hypothetical protein